MESTTKRGNSFSKIKDDIQPHLEATRRWYHTAEEGLQYQDEFDENVWQHVQSCNRRAIRLFQQYPELKKYVDLKTLLQTILLHDAPEGYAKHGDVSQEDPDHDRKKAENDEEGVFQEEIIGRLKLPEEMTPLYMGYENRNTLVGTIAKLIDTVDAEEMWWNNLTAEYRLQLILEVQDFDVMTTKFLKQLLERLAQSGVTDSKIIQILVDYLINYMMSEISLLPEELQESQREGIIKAKERLLQES